MTAAHLLLQALAALVLAPAAGGNVSLAWDQNTSPNLAGNRVYVGTASRTYGAPITIPLQTEYTVTGLTPGTYYFAVTAFDTSGLESDFSNEVSTTIAQPFEITSQSASLRWFGVVLLATTSEKASAMLRYRKIEDGARWYTVIAAPTPTKTEHRVVLYFPAGKTFFAYEWTVTSAGGRVVVETGTFQTR